MKEGGEKTLINTCSKYIETRMNAMNWIQQSKGRMESCRRHVMDEGLGHSRKESKSCRFFFN